MAGGRGRTRREQCGETVGNMAKSGGGTGGLGERRACIECGMGGAGMPAQHQQQGRGSGQGRTRFRTAAACRSCKGTDQARRSGPVA